MAETSTLTEGPQIQKLPQPSKKGAAAPGAKPPPTFVNPGATSTPDKPTSTGGEGAVQADKLSPTTPAVDLSKAQKPEPQVDSKAQEKTDKAKTDQLLKEAALMAAQKRTNKKDEDSAKLEPLLIKDFKLKELVWGRHHKEAWAKLKEFPAKIKTPEGKRAMTTLIKEMPGKMAENWGKNGRAAQAQADAMLKVAMFEDIGVAIASEPQLQALFAETVKQDARAEDDTKKAELKQGGRLNKLRSLFTGFRRETGTNTKQLAIKELALMEQVVDVAKQIQAREQLSPLHLEMIKRHPDLVRGVLDLGLGHMAARDLIITEMIQTDADNDILTAAFGTEINGPLADRLKAMLIARIKEEALGSTTDSELKTTMALGAALQEHRTAYPQDTQAAESLLDSAESVDTIIALFAGLTTETQPHALGTSMVQTYQKDVVLGRYIAEGIEVNILAEGEKILQKYQEARNNAPDAPNNLSYEEAMNIAEARAKAVRKRSGLSRFTTGTGMVTEQVARKVLGMATFGTSMYFFGGQRGARAGQEAARERLAVKETQKVRSGQQTEAGVALGDPKEVVIAASSSVEQFTRHLSRTAKKIKDGDVTPDTVSDALATLAEIRALREIRDATPKGEKKRTVFYSDTNGLINSEVTLRDKLGPIKRLQEIANQKKLRELNRAEARVKAALRKNTDIQALQQEYGTPETSLDAIIQTLSETQRDTVEKRVAALDTLAVARTKGRNTALIVAAVGATVVGGGEMLILDAASGGGGGDALASDASSGPQEVSSPALESAAYETPLTVDIDPSAKLVDFNLPTGQKIEYPGVLQPGVDAKGQSVLIDADHKIILTQEELQMASNMPKDTVFKFDAQAANGTGAWDIVDGQTDMTSIENVSLDQGKFNGLVVQHGKEETLDLTKLPKGAETLGQEVLPIHPSEIVTTHTTSHVELHFDTEDSGGQGFRTSAIGDGEGIRFSYVGHTHPTHYTFTVNGQTMAAEADAQGNLDLLFNSDQKVHFDHGPDMTTKEFTDLVINKEQFHHYIDDLGVKNGGIGTEMHHGGRDIFNISPDGDKHGFIRAATIDHQGDKTIINSLATIQGTGKLPTEIIPTGSQSVSEHALDLQSDETGFTIHGQKFEYPGGAHVNPETGSLISNDSGTVIFDANQLTALSQIDLTPNDHLVFQFDKDSFKWDMVDTQQHITVIENISIDGANQLHFTPTQFATIGPNGQVVIPSAGGGINPLPPGGGALPGSQPPSHFEDGDIAGRLREIFVENPREIAERLFRSIGAPLFTSVENTYDFVKFVYDHPFTSLLIGTSVGGLVIGGVALAMRRARARRQKQRPRGTLPPQFVTPTFSPTVTPSPVLPPPAGPTGPGFTPPPPPPAGPTGPGFTPPPPPPAGPTGPTGAPSPYAPLGVPPPYTPPGPPPGPLTGLAGVAGGGPPQPMTAAALGAQIGNQLNRGLHAALASPRLTQQEIQFQIGSPELTTERNRILYRLGANFPNEDIPALDAVIARFPRTTDREGYIDFLNHTVPLNGNMILDGVEEGEPVRFVDPSLDRAYQQVITDNPTSVNVFHPSTGRVYNLDPFEFVRRLQPRLSDRYSGTLANRFATVNTTADPNAEYFVPNPPTNWQITEERARRYRPQRQVPFLIPTPTGSFASPIAASFAYENWQVAVDASGNLIPANMTQLRDKTNPPYALGEAADQFRSGWWALAKESAGIPPEQAILYATVSNAMLDMLARPEGREIMEEWLTAQGNLEPGRALGQIGSPNSPQTSLDYFYRYDHEDAPEWNLKSNQEEQMLGYDDRGEYSRERTLELWQQRVQDLQHIDSPLNPNNQTLNFDVDVIGQMELFAHMIDVTAILSDIKAPRSPLFEEREIVDPAAQNPIQTGFSLLQRDTNRPGRITGIDADDVRHPGDPLVHILLADGGTLNRRMIGLEQILAEENGAWLPLWRTELAADQQQPLRIFLASRNSPVRGDATYRAAVAREVDAFVRDAPTFSMNETDLANLALNFVTWNAAHPDFQVDTDDPFVSDLIDTIDERLGNRSDYAPYFDETVNAIYGFVESGVDARFTVSRITRADFTPLARLYERLESIRENNSLEDLEEGIQDLRNFTGIDQTEAQWDQRRQTVIADLPATVNRLVSDNLPEDRLINLLTDITDFVHTNENATAQNLSVDSELFFNIQVSVRESLRGRNIAIETETAITNIISTFANGNRENFIQDGNVEPSTHAAVDYLIQFYPRSDTVTEGVLPPPDNNDLDGGPTPSSQPTPSHESGARDATTEAAASLPEPGALLRMGPDTFIVGRVEGETIYGTTVTPDMQRLSWGTKDFYRARAEEIDARQKAHEVELQLGDLETWKRDISEAGREIRARDQHLIEITKYLDLDRLPIVLDNVLRTAFRSGQTVEQTFQAAGLPLPIRGGTFVGEDGKTYTITRVKNNVITWAGPTQTTLPMTLTEFRRHQREGENGGDGGSPAATGGSRADGDGGAPPPPISGEVVTSRPRPDSTAATAAGSLMFEPPPRQATPTPERQRTPVQLTELFNGLSEFRQNEPLTIRASQGARGSITLPINSQPTTLDFAIIPGVGLTYHQGESPLHTIQAVTRTRDGATLTVDAVGLDESDVYWVNLVDTRGNALSLPLSRLLTEGYGYSIIDRQPSTPSPEETATEESIAQTISKMKFNFTGGQGIHGMYWEGVRKAVSDYLPETIKEIVDTTDLDEDTVIILLQDISDSLASRKASDQPPSDANIAIADEALDRYVTSELNTNFPEGLTAENPLRDNISAEVARILDNNVILSYDPDGEIIEEATVHYVVQFYVTPPSEDVELDLDQFYTDNLSYKPTDWVAPGTRAIDSRDTADPTIAAFRKAMFTQLANELSIDETAFTDLQRELVTTLASILTSHQKRREIISQLASSIKTAPQDVEHMFLNLNGKTYELVNILSPLEGGEYIDHQPDAASLTVREYDPINKTYEESDLWTLPKFIEQLQHLPPTPVG